MADYTRPATWDDLRELARYLESAGVEYALVGGYAIAVHGINRYSEDIDILVEPSAENARRSVYSTSKDCCTPSRACDRRIRWMPQCWSVPSRR